MTSLPQYANLPDVAKDTTFLRFLKNLPSKPATTVRIFQRKNYYTVHHEDAVLAEKNLLKVVLVDVAGVPSAYVSAADYARFLRFLLLDKTYRVEVYGLQSDDCGSVGGLWELVLNASPGYLVEVEDVLFPQDAPEASAVESHSAGVAAIQLTTRRQQANQATQQLTLGIAFCDPVLQSLQIAQLEDDVTLAQLQVLLIQVSPKEVVIPAKGECHDQLVLLLRLNRIIYHEVGADQFSETKNLDADLGRLHKTTQGKKTQQQRQSIGAVLPELQRMEAAHGPLAAVLSHLQLLANPANLGQFTVREIPVRQLMRLDWAAVDALHLLPVGELGKRDTVYGLLCNARTPGGQRTVANWIKQPLVDKAKIEERLDMVEFLVDNSVIREKLEGSLKRFPDLSMAAKRLHMKKVRLVDLYKLFVLVKNIPSLVSTLSEGESESPALEDAILKRLRKLNDDFDKYVEMIEEVIDLDRAESSREYLVRPSFDEALQTLSNEIDRWEAQMQRLWDQTAREMRVEKGKVLRMEPAGGQDQSYVFRVTHKDASHVRGKPKFQIVDEKNKGIMFVSHELKELNDEYVKVKAEYRRMQQTLVKDIIDIAAGYSDAVYQLAEVVSLLDAVLSLAIAAVNGNFVRPKIAPAESGELDLKGVRHPLVENRTGNFVANDAHFVSGRNHFQLLTGPNMGGKSTYMRSIAICVVLAQMGSFVPCDEALVSIRDSVLTRLGMGDVTIRATSTFMMEMQEMSFIMRMATPNSLVLVDELGRGTSTYDGMGLAWGFAESLAQTSRSMTVYATHFHELTALEALVPGVVNQHVSAHIDTTGAFTLLYKVMPDANYKSYGIQVAELNHMPKDMVDAAKHMLTEYGSVEHFIEFVKQTKDARDCEAAIESFCGQCDAVMADASLSDEQKQSRISTGLDELQKRHANNPLLTKMIASF